MCSGVEGWVTSVCMNLRGVAVVARGKLSYLGWLNLRGLPRVEEGRLETLGLPRCKVLGGPYAGQIRVRRVVWCYGAWRRETGVICV